MSSVMAVVRREIQAYFVSPIAYTVIVSFLLVSGFGFTSELRDYLGIRPLAFELRSITLQGALVSQIATWISIAIFLCLPALSMRLLSEERRSGTIELLMTSPLTTLQIVVGKYLGALSVYVLILVLTLPYLAILEMKGSPEWGAIGATYLGLLLFGGVILAIGLFASAITENQIIAVVTTYAIFMPFFVLDRLVRLVGSQLGDVLAGLSVSVGLFSMSQGLVDSHDLVLHCALVFLFLFLSVQVLDSSRWR